MSEPTPETPTLLMWDAFGRRLDADVDEILDTLRDPLTLIFHLLAITTFVVLDALSLRAAYGLAATIGIWGIAVPAHTLFFNALNILTAHLQFRFGLGRVYLPVLGLIAYIGTGASFTALLALFGQQSFAAAFDPTLLALGYPLALVFELFYFAFVIPLRDTTLALQQTDERSLLVAGQPVPIADLVLIRSQEHHVQIVKKTAVTRIRARLGDLVDQTAPEDGVLAHRSYWVARSAIVAHAREADRCTSLTLHDGRQLPVARPRQCEVRAWLEAHLPEVAHSTAPRAATPGPQPPTSAPLS